MHKRKDSKPNNLSIIPVVGARNSSSINYGFLVQSLLGIYFLVIWEVSLQQQPIVSDVVVQSFSPDSVTIQEDFILPYD